MSTAFKIRYGNRCSDNCVLFCLTWRCGRAILNAVECKIFASEDYIAEGGNGQSKQKARACGLRIIQKAILLEANLFYRRSIDYANCWSRPCIDTTEVYTHGSYFISTWWYPFGVPRWSFFSSTIPTFGQNHLSFLVPIHSSMRLKQLSKRPAGTMIVSVFATRRSMELDPNISHLLPTLNGSTNSSVSSLLSGCVAGSSSLWKIRSPITTNQ